MYESRICNRAGACVDEGENKTIATRDTVEIRSLAVTMVLRTLLVAMSRCNLHQLGGRRSSRRAINRVGRVDETPGRPQNLHGQVYDPKYRNRLRRCGPVVRRQQRIRSVFPLHSARNQKKDEK